MKFSAGVSWLVLLLLPPTLAWKLTVRPGVAIQLEEKAAVSRLTEFLTREHFAFVDMSSSAEEGGLTIRAASGQCRMIVAKSPPVGWNREAVRLHGTPADTIFVVFRGRLYSEQPTWLTVTDFLWTRFQRELGFKIATHLVLTVIASTACDAKRLPWDKLE